MKSPSSLREIPHRVALAVAARDWFARVGLAAVGVSMARLIVGSSTCAAQRCFTGRMAYIALTLSIAIAVLGAVGIFVPTVLLAVSRPFLTPVGLYAAAGVRVVLGTALFLAAPASRAPTTLRILCVVIVVAGIVTPLVGVERARAVVDWWTGQGSALMRLWAGMALTLGLFLAYAVMPPTPGSDRR